MNDFNEKLNDAINALDYKLKEKGVKDANLANLLKEVVSSARKDNINSVGSKFGHRNDVSSEQKNSLLIESLLKCSDLMSNKIDSMIENKEIMKAYMLESQKIAIDSVCSVVGISNDSTLNNEDLAEGARIIIKNELSLLNSSNAIKEEFQDYHNHDPVLLEDSFKAACDYTREKLRDLRVSPESFNSINSIARYSAEFSVDKFSQSPDSPFDQAGLVSEISHEKEKSKVHEHSLDNNFNSPVMSR